MKAVQFNEYGDASVLRVADIEKPSASAGQVLVDVAAVSLNPFDSKLRDGVMKEMIPLNLPITIGGDIAGVIADASDSSYAVGDKVYGQANAVAGNSGAFAEFAATKANQIAKAPSNLSLEEAASLPLIGVSALQAVHDHLKVQSGQKLFIHGGGGGIGGVAIQIAKSVGAYVATTATGSDIDYVRSLGADEVIDYVSEDYAETLSSYDAAFDTVGDDFDKMLGILTNGGKAVSMIASADEGRVSELGVTAHTQGTQVTTEKLDALRELVESGVVTVRIGKTFPLEQVVEAFQTREAGEKGKVVVTLS